jgi:pantoate--beta-alanine ligase
MKLIRSLSRITSVLKEFRKKEKRIGFVPTMGAFHEGHISLIRKAKKENDIVVVSIFINPAQFAPNEDYEKYPRDIRRDREKAKKAGCDILFYPDAGSMYPKGYNTHVEVYEYQTLMCGRSRPGHFSAVATICAKLFNIITPDTAYFGRKDYQQALIVKNMVNDLNMDLKIKILPTVREKSGIALSSRNRYLLPAQIEDAKLLYQALKKAGKIIRQGERDVSRIRSAMRKILNKPGMNIDYISIVSPDTLREKRRIDSKVLIALAARIGETRLIDNIVVRIKN